MDALAAVGAKKRNQLLGRLETAHGLFRVGPHFFNRHQHSARRRKVEGVVEVLGEVVVHENQVDGLPTVFKRVGVKQVVEPFQFLLLAVREQYLRA